MNNDALALAWGSAEVQPLEKQVQPRRRIDGLGAFDAPLARLLAAGSEKHGGELPAEIVEVNVAAETLVGLELDAGRHDAGELGVEDLVRQPIGRDRVAKHAAELGILLEDRHLIPAAAKMIGSRQPRRTAANDRDRLGPLLGRSGQRPFLAQSLIPEEAFDRVDRNRLI